MKRVECYYRPTAVDTNDELHVAGKVLYGTGNFVMYILHDTFKNTHNTLT
jgi:hypothetical protein